MRGLRYVEHKWVLLDECLPKHIFAQKKFFQAQPLPIVLGSSPTGCHQYECYAHRMPFIICANDWAEEMAKLKKPSDVEWLEANTFVFTVLHKLY